MKRKIKLMIGFVVAIGVIGIIVNYTLGPFTEKGWTKKLFGINESRYEVVSRDNQLSRSEYGGSYSIKIRVREDQMDSFLSDIRDAHFYMLAEDPEVDITMYFNVVKNITGEDMDINSKLYAREGEVERKILFASSEPKTVESYVYYSKCVDGVYEVYLSYLE